ncbi:hypothetical protein SAMN04488519_106122 [Algoriphagus ornithinivorans]|uniref:Uncharacterized protein n=1 Tax=Algoriphagus ornithinivorans TaxID=226506 RepID=A0A1I5GWX0_9BACT|nr:hypothetical protein SAMN04488519_106122 [Algoriphagus ornithinivorans]
MVSIAKGQQTSPLWMNLSYNFLYVRRIFKAQADTRAINETASYFLTILGIVLEQGEVQRTDL